MHGTSLILRPATDDDAAAVARLVELEEALPLIGAVLLAELDGHVIAAVCVREGRAVADIFRPTAEVVAMLRAWRDALIRARRFTNVGAAERPRRFARSPRASPAPGG